MGEPSPREGVRVLEPTERFDYETPFVESLPVAENPPIGVPEAPPTPAIPAPSRLAMLWPALRELIETILLTLVIFLMIRFAVENFRIEGYSMEPNFHDGQFLLVNKIAYKVGHPQRNDVIIFHFPLNETKNYIKRVIGLPGETVQVTDGQVYVDDNLVAENYPFEHADYSWGPAVVPSG